jgi:hypothetical protein
MSEKVNLANAIVDAMLHPDSRFNEDPLKNWRSSLTAVSERVISAASVTRGDPDALGITAAATRLAAKGNLANIDDLAKALLEAVNKVEEISKL